MLLPLVYDELRKLAARSADARKSNFERCRNQSL